jgi:glycosyltransferase involved in cell wall biosynthesis
MIVVIEASNILAGGGIVHLKELLAHADPAKYNFNKVVVWACQNTLNKLPEKDWLEKKTHPCLNRNVFYRLLWQRFILPKELKQNVDVVFVPGANIIRFPRILSMCQNLLPFDQKERKLFGNSLIRIRLKALNYVQSEAFKMAQKVILLTPSNLHYLQQNGLNIAAKTVVIPHGVNSVFFNRPIASTSHAAIRILYVSIVNEYKHQWNVALAVFGLLDLGYKVELEFVGTANAIAFQKLKSVLSSRPEYAEQVSYKKYVPYEQLQNVYQSADIFVFASSCESFSLILLEAMASGLPIACSNVDTLKDTLGEAGVYFDPYNVNDIKRAILHLLQNETLRNNNAKLAFEKSKMYSWSECADRTFQSLQEVANGK